MIKRKPGRPRKVESTIEGAIPEKRKRGRPPKAAITSTPASTSAELFGYVVHTSNGYGAETKHVYAHTANVNEGRLLLRKHDRIVAAFNTWDDFIEMEKPVEPPKVDMPKGHIESTPDGTGYQFQSNGTFPISATIGIADFPAQQAAQNGGTDWGQKIGAPDGAVFYGQHSIAAPTIEIVESERPE